MGADQTTRNLRIRDRLKFSKSTRVLEVVFNAISVQDGSFATQDDYEVRGLASGLCATFFASLSFGHR